MKIEKLVKKIVVLQAQTASLKHQLKSQLDDATTLEDLVFKKVVFYDDFTDDNQSMLDKLIQGKKLINS